MLDMDEEELMAELVRSFNLADDCDERITGSLKEMMQELDRLISVSYTHLDVYKRQLIDRVIDRMLQLAAEGSN